jgi:hypothetical protein
MPPALQFGSKTAQGSQLHPALKDFLDVVVIPALVKAYLLENGNENRLALVPNDVQHSPSEESVLSEGIP